jgi:sigma-E factor negative regulatory protein RseA
MSDEIREQLSALMDGELPRDQVRFLLRRLDGDVQLTQAWTRYQVAAGVLRRQAAVHPLRADFADVLMQRVEAGQNPIGARLLRWAGGGAIAAAVAVFALVSTRPPAGAPEPAALVAAATPAATAPVEVAAKGAMPALPLQPAFDLAQPASFDKDYGVISLPRYRRDQPAMLGPYVLLTAPAAQTESPPQH